MTLPDSITVVGKRNWNELVEKLKQVTLMGDTSVYPYREAHMELKLVGLEEIYPISKYVLRGQLEFQERLHELLLKQGINSLQLTPEVSDITFKVEGEMGMWLLSPPIVEESINDGNKLVLTDGEHRLMLARKLGQKVRVVVIKGVVEAIPPVAFPVEWSEVVTYDQVPEAAKKRNYRFTDEAKRYFFYRDLSPVATTAVRPVGANGNAT